MSLFNKIPNLLLCSVPLLALIAFTGINVYWVRDAYDGWRIFQIITLMMFSAYAVFIRTHSSPFSRQTNKIIAVTLPVLFGLVVASCWLSEYSARAAADAALYALLAISVWAQANIFRKNQTIAPHIAAWLAVLPLFMVISLFTELVHASVDQISYDWHLSFANIRMLDDALLPCLFLLWQRPAWLSKNYFRYSLFNQGITTTIYLTSTAYLLILLYDGARAVLISTLVGLAFIALCRRDTWSNLRLPFLTILGAGLLFLTLKHMILPDFLANPIIRTGSSGRDGLWLKTVALWQEHPILGVGGNNFVTSNPWILNAHPHNMPLQLLSEWGIAGLLTMLLLMPLTIQIFRHRQILPTFALGAVVAVAVDAFFSGILNYPLSQMLGIWSLAWLVSLLPHHLLDSKSSAQQVHFSKIAPNVPAKSDLFMLKVIAVTAIVVMLSVHGRDITCRNCMSTDNDNAPRFWQYGRALHLVAIGSESVNNTPEALQNNH